MPEPTISDIAKAICCPREEQRCEGPCPLAENSHTAAAMAVRAIYRGATPETRLLEDSAQRSAPNGAVVQS